MIPVDLTNLSSEHCMFYLGSFCCRIGTGLLWPGGYSRSTWEKRDTIFGFESVWKCSPKTRIDRSATWRSKLSRSTSIGKRLPQGSPQLSLAKSNVLANAHVRHPHNPSRLQRTLRLLEETSRHVKPVPYYT